MMVYAYMCVVYIVAIVKNLCTIGDELQKQYLVANDNCSPQKNNGVVDIKHLMSATMTSMNANKKWHKEICKKPVPNNNMVNNHLNENDNENIHQNNQNENQMNGNEHENEPSSEMNAIGNNVNVVQNDMN